MLGKVGTLREIFHAPRDRAKEGFLLCMNSQVVEKVAPFSELFSTALVLAFHHSSHSLGDGVLEAEDFEVVGIWNVSAFTYSVESLRVAQAISFSENSVELLQA